MDISTDHIRSRSAEVCQPLRHPLGRPCWVTLVFYLLKFGFETPVFKGTGLAATHGNSFHPFEQHSPFFFSLCFSFRGEGKVGSYVTRRHWDAVRRGGGGSDAWGTKWAVLKQQTTQAHTDTHKHKIDGRHESSGQSRSSLLRSRRTA